MGFWLADMFTSPLVSGGWSATKNLGRGLKSGTVGKTIKKDKDTGLEYSVSPFRDGLLKDLKNNTSKMLTGRSRDKNGVKGDYEFANHFGGFGGAVADVALGLPMHALGWTAGTVGKAGLATGMWAAPKVARQAGYTTREAFNLFGDTAINATEMVLDLNKTKTGQNILFTAGLAGAVGIGGLAAMAEASDSAVKNGLRAYVGEDLDQIPGTVSQPMQKVDNLGADGSLVFAMHQLR